MKKIILYSLFFTFIQSIAGNAQPQIASRLVRTEDSSGSIFEYTNTVYQYSGGRGNYKQHPVLGTYIQFDTSVTVYLDFSSAADSIMTVYQYDAHSNPVRQYNLQKYSGGIWELKTADSAIYDLKNNLRRYYRGSAINGVFHYDSRVDFDYNNKGQMISRQSTSFDNPQYNRLITYSFDASNNLAEQITYWDDNGIWVNHDRMIYLYAANVLLQQTYELWGVSQWRNDYDYNTNKLLIKTSHYSYTGTGLQLQGRDSNIYDANGDLSLHFYTNNMTGSIKKDTNIYDANHNQVSSFSSYYNASAGMYQNSHLRTTTYNKYDQPLIKREYDWEPSTSSWEHSKQGYYYEKNYYEEYVTGVEPVQQDHNMALIIYPSSEIVKWSIKDLKVLDRVPTYYSIGHLMVPGGDTKKPYGKYVVAYNKITKDRYLPTGPELAQSAQLYSIEGDKMQLLLDYPTIGEPHYAQAIYRNYPVACIVYYFCPLS